MREVVVEYEGDGFYGRIQRRDSLDDQYVEFEGFVGQPRADGSYSDRDTVTVDLPWRSSWASTTKSDPATVNWQSMGFRSIEHTSAYGALIQRAIAFAVAEQEERLVE